MKWSSKLHKKLPIGVLYSRNHHQRAATSITVLMVRAGIENGVYFHETRVAGGNSDIVILYGITDEKLDKISHIADHEYMFPYIKNKVPVSDKNLLEFFTISLDRLKKTKLKGVVRIYLSDEDQRISFSNKRDIIKLLLTRVMVRGISDRNGSYVCCRMS